MEKRPKSVQSQLEKSIEEIVLNYLRKVLRSEIEAIHKEFGNNRPLDLADGYLAVKDLLIKYHVSRKHFYTLRKLYYIDCVTSGRSKLYSELDYLEACRKHRPKRPGFLKPFFMLKILPVFENLKKCFCLLGLLQPNIAEIVFFCFVASDRTYKQRISSS